MKQMEWMVQIIAGSCNVQIKCSKNSAINVQVDNQDSTLYDCLMFIRLALYLPNTIGQGKHEVQKYSSYHEQTRRKRNI